MPAKYKGSWDARHARWAAMVRRQRLTISCKQLSEHFHQAIPATKEGSYRFFNAWLEERRAEAPKPFEMDLAECERRRDWCRSTGDMLGAAAFEGMLENHKRFGDGLTVSMLEQGKRVAAFNALDEAGLASSLEHPGEIPAKLVDRLAGESVWQERLPIVPASHTLGGLAGTYNTLKSGKVERGELTPKAYRNIRDAVNRFVEWCGPTSPATTINEDKWAAYNAHLIGLGNSPTYTSRLASFTRGFVQYLYEQGKIQLPRNLASRDLTVTVSPQEVKVIPLDLVRRMLAIAQDECRLHILLALNCGMRQQDISDLRPNEVDWSRGVIVRKRSKTRTHESVPTVSYRLWGETFELLKAYRSTDPDRVLLTPKGEPWVSKGFEGGKVIASDKLGKHYDRQIRSRLEGVGPFKTLRNTSNSLIDNNPQFGGAIATLFLGQSPRSIKDKSYSRVSTDRLDAALAWLHDQFFPTTQ